MTKLYYNYYKVTNNLLTQLGDSKKKVDAALRQINLMNIPYDFDYKNYLVNLSTKLNNYIKDIKGIEDTIDFSNKSLVKVTDEFSVKVSKIEKININIRESIIK